MVDSREQRRDQRVRESTSPSIPDPTSENLLEVVKKLKAALDSREGRLGNPVDGFVSFRDLVRLGLCRNRPGTPSYGSQYVVGDKTFPVEALPYFSLALYSGDQDQTPPPKPTNLQVTTVSGNKVLTWDQKDYHNHHYFLVYRSPDATFENAYIVGSTVGKVFADATGAGTRYYWVRAVSEAGVESVLNSPTGLLG